MNENSRLRLLVEGYTDKTCMIGLAKSRWPRHEVYISDCGGADKILSQASLQTELNFPGLQALGVILDADASVEATYQSLRDCCSLSLDLPVALPADGLIIEGAPRFGAWIMPNNDGIGGLESFLWNLVPSSSQPAAQRFLNWFGRLFEL